MVAARLSENEALDVVLIEEGGMMTPYGHRATWSLALAFDAVTSRSWSVETGSADDLRLITGRTVGGSGRINGGYFIRPTSADLDAWSDAVGDNAWGSRLLKAMITSETDRDHPDSPLHGTDGPIAVSRDSTPAHPVSSAFLEAAGSCGIEQHEDHNDGGVHGIGPVALNSLDGSLFDPGLAYLEPALRRPNLTLLSEHRVVRLISGSGRIRGVEVVNGGRPEVIPADDVVLCAGTFGTPAILFASGIGPADQLRAVGVDPIVDNPVVGQRYWNHPQVDLSFTPSPMASRPNGSNDSFMQFVAHLDESSGHVANAEYMATRRPYGVVTGLDPSDRSLSLRITLLDATAGGTIRAGVNGIEITDHHRDSPRDLTRLRRAIGFGLELLSTDAFREVTTDREQVPAEVPDDWLSSNLLSAFHMIGSCPMGDSADTTVVDATFRLHGLDGLRIVDASVIPLQISRGPAAAVVGLAELAAEMISTSEQA